MTGRGPLVELLRADAPRLARRTLPEREALTNNPYPRCAAVFGCIPFPSLHRQQIAEGNEIGSPMSDPHIRLLTAAARHSQHRLDAHDDEAAGNPRTESTIRRRIALAQRAARTRDRLKVALARRRNSEPRDASNE